MESLKLRRRQIYDEYFNSDNTCYSNKFISLETYAVGHQLEGSSNGQEVIKYKQCIKQETPFNHNFMSNRGAIRDIKDLEILSNNKTVKKSSIPNDVDVVLVGNKRILKKKKTSKSIKNKTEVNTKLKIVLTILIIAAFLYYNISHQILKSVGKLPLETIRENLEEMMIGQKQQIEDILYAFEEFSRFPRNTHISFLGTSGVGKTYCANNIKNSLKNFQVLDINLNKESDLKSFHFDSSQPVFIILDNLYYGDISKTIQFLNLSIKSYEKLIFLTIFNIETSSDFLSSHVNVVWLENIINSMKQIESKFYPIVFHSFDEYSLLEHFETFKSIFRGFLSGLCNWEETFFKHDIKTNGFKGLFAKLSLNSCNYN